jgi:hypothetical protein
LNYLITSLNGLNLFFAKKMENPYGIGTPTSLLKMPWKALGRMRRDGIFTP